MKLLTEEKKAIIRRLIPLAVKEADAVAKIKGSGAWSGAYHKAMDRLAKEEGVRK